MTITEAVNKILLSLDETEDEEFTSRMIEQIDSVQKEIATMLKPIRKIGMIIANERMAIVPTGLYEIIKIYNDDIIPHYKRIGSTIYIDPEEEHTDTEVNTIFTIEYNAYPTTITTDTARTTSLEIDGECAEALIYGVCAALTIDDLTLYDTFNNKYNNMLVNIQNRIYGNTIATVRGGYII